MFYHIPGELLGISPVILVRFRLGFLWANSWVKCVVTGVLDHFAVISGA
jgi:hypothetical protein